MTAKLSGLLLIGISLAASPAARPAAAAAGGSPALVATYSGIISPVTAEFLGDAVRKANRENFAALIIQLDTPGGLDTSMRVIVKDILNSETPVIVYVSPSGARAASAGVFITMAAQVAAMAPGTNIGAAHPVMLGGPPPSFPGKKEEKAAQQPIEEKAVNDAAAYLRSIARRRNRNEQWAEKAVTESISIPVEEAVDKNIVDFKAENMDDLIGRLNAPPWELRIENSRLVYMEMNERQKLLATISDPNIALLLMSLGAAGLFIELYNPGLILPGIAGGISLILALYSFQTLSANYAGILLILLGFLLFFSEIFVPSFGLLTAGGVISNLLGVLMLFNKQPSSGISISWSVVAGNLAGMVALTSTVAFFAYRALRKKPATGLQAMIGAEGTAQTPLKPAGAVLIGGELWNALSLEGEIPQGAAVEVAEIKDLVLKVRRKS